MASLLSSSGRVIGVYCERLRNLTDELCADPLSERKTLAVVEHIVNNRGHAMHMWQLMQSEHDHPTDTAVDGEPVDHHDPLHETRSPASDDDGISLSYYCAHLRQLIDDLKTDPLSLQSSIRFLRHVVNGRGYATYLSRILDADHLDNDGASREVQG